MKYLLIINTIIISILLINCNQGKQKSKVNLGNFKPGKYCYTANFEGDSASLNYAIDKYGRVTGKLYIKYGEVKPGAAGREINLGDITGECKGDTLIADYVFTSTIAGTSFHQQYSNPIALLRKGDSLTMGKGRIMSYLGRNYFDDKTPIDFEKSRFRFKVSDCKPALL